MSPDYFHSNMTPLYLMQQNFFTIGAGTLREISKTGVSFV